jgi:DivIVA domain-containing protein
LSPLWPKVPQSVILEPLVDDDSLHAEERESELLASKEIRNVSFPGSVRGYDRTAVDAYVKRVNRVIAELEMRSSPRAAVRHALEQVGEQTSGILQRAREAAEEITAAARQEAEETTARAKAEAAETVVDASTQADRAKVEAEQLIAKARAEAEGIVTAAKAEAEKVLARTREEAAALQEEGEARLRELHAEIATTWKERRELLDDVRGIATRLQKAASEAAARTAPEGADELPEGEMLELEFEPNEPTQVATAGQVTEPDAASVEETR